MTPTRLLKEIASSRLTLNNNLMATLHSHVQITSPKTPAFVTENMLAFMQSTRRHRELMTEYYPTTNSTELEKIKLTANRVGLDMPKMFLNALGEEAQPAGASSVKKVATKITGK